MYKSLVSKTIIILLSFLIILALSLPILLKSLGLHPDYDSKTFELNGRKALIITSSHNVLNLPGEVRGKPTGVASSELTIPYYEFMNSGMDVDIASIKGGEIPIDPETLIYLIRTQSDKKFQNDIEAMKKLKNSMLIDNVDFTKYDLIYIAGGWGAAYDLGYSEILGSKISEAYYANKIIGAVCHGPLGLINAKDKNGNLLISGRTMTGATDKQIKELGIEMTPQHPETELRKAGVIFESKSKFNDLFANHVAVDDERRFVTGQNQNAGHETAQIMMSILAEEI